MDDYIFYAFPSGTFFILFSCFYTQRNSLFIQWSSFLVTKCYWKCYFEICWCFSRQRPLLSWMANTLKVYATIKMRIKICYCVYQTNHWNQILLFSQVVYGTSFLIFSFIWFWLTLLFSLSLFFLSCFPWFLILLHVLQCVSCHISTQFHCDDLPCISFTSCLLFVMEDSKMLGRLNTRGCCFTWDFKNKLALISSLGWNWRIESYDGTKL